METSRFICFGFICFHIKKRNQLTHNDNAPPPTALLLLNLLSFMYNEALTCDTQQSVVEAFVVFIFCKKKLMSVFFDVE